MRRRATTAAIAATALLLAPAGASAAADAVKIKTADQGKALATGTIAVRVRVAEPARVELTASAPGTRRLSGRERVRFAKGGSRNALLPLTAPGRAALEGASARCELLTITVRAKVDDGGRGGTRGDAAQRPLAADQDLCQRPGEGGGDGALPAPGPGAPGPGPGPDPDPDPEPGPTKLKAGAAVADITPPVGTPMFAYTARSRVADPPQSPEDAMQVVADPAPDQNLYAKTFEPSEGIHTRLRASAIVIEREGEKFALVQADLGGLPYALVQAVQDRIAATGIAADHIVISATHSHSATGPIWPADNLGYQALGGDFFDPRVFGITADGIAEAIVEADRSLEPARVGLGTSELDGASNNRAFEAFQRNEDVPDAREQELKLNRTVTVVRADGTDGAPIGTWSNFAVHPTSFGDSNLLFSGDNAATTERLVEDEVGGTLVWSNGAEGDVSPNGGSPAPDGEPLDYVNSSAASANMTGLKVAGGIVAAWEDAGGHLAGDLELEAHQVFKLFDGDEADGMPVGPITALGAGIVQEGFCSPVENVAGPGQGAKFPLIAGVGLVPQTAPISLLRIGDTAIAAMPFEITTQMGRRISAAVTDAAGGELDGTVIAGLSNGYLSYTSTPEEYDACAYEGSFTLFGRHQGPLLRDTATSLVPAVVGGGEAPASDPEPAPVGFDVPNSANPVPTPDAGAVVAEPGDARRFDRVSFTWKGGDPSVDATRGETFVSLQRLQGGEWVTVGTEDGPEDVTVYDNQAGAWTETWQFSSCEPLGTYRFVVTGRAVTAPAGAPEEYAATSDEFELGPTEPLEVIDAVADGGVARVRARYPDPGPAILALPRRVRDGEARITLAGGREVVARPDDQGLGFEARVPAGAQIADVAVTDACGNSTP
ncbi:MAG TPA: neutral/alkaline non-lysosomal ceramidase N-terminal domain-containing protein [Solirubrobacterales bacterium]